MIRLPRPSWCSVLGLRTVSRLCSQSTSDHRRARASLGTRSPPNRLRAISSRHSASGAASITLAIDCCDTNTARGSRSHATRPSASLKTEIRPPPELCGSRHPKMKNPNVSFRAIGIAGVASENRICSVRGVERFRPCERGAFRTSGRNAPGYAEECRSADASGESSVT